MLNKHAFQRGDIVHAADIRSRLTSEVQGGSARSRNFLS